jgi:hypothetical protein
MFIGVAAAHLPEESARPLTQAGLLSLLSKRVILGFDPDRVGKGIFQMKSTSIFFLSPL